MKEERIPADSDPIWAKKSEPVLDFLSEPRSWRELRGFMRKMKIGQNRLNNCLAWLENRGLAYSYTGEDEITLWLAVGAPLRPYKADPSLGPKPKPAASQKAQKAPKEDSPSNDP